MGRQNDTTVKSPIVMRANRAAAKGEEIPCPECGMMFKPFTYDEDRGKYTGVFCCIQCATAWYNAHPQSKEDRHPAEKKATASKKILKRCKICGKRFEVMPVAGGAMYCSSECRKAAAKIARDKFRKSKKASSATWIVSI